MAVNIWVIICLRDVSSFSVASSLFWASSSFNWRAAFSWDKVTSACSVSSIFFSAETRAFCSVFTSSLSREIFSSALAASSYGKKNASSWAIEFQVKDIPKPPWQDNPGLGGYVSSFWQVLKNCSCEFQTTLEISNNYLKATNIKFYWIYSIGESRVTVNS